MSARRRWQRFGAWAGLVLLVLDIFLGTAIPVARAAQSEQLIPLRDLLVCGIDGIQPAADSDDSDDRGTSATGIYCSACLPLVQLVAPPDPPLLGRPARIHAFVFATPELPWPSKTVDAGFSARAPPFSV